MPLDVNVRSALSTPLDTPLEGSSRSSADSAQMQSTAGRRGVRQVFQAALREVGASGMLYVAVEAGLVAFQLGGRGFAQPVAFLDDAVLSACVWSARMQSAMEWLVGERRVVVEKLEHDPSLRCTR